MNPDRLEPLRKFKPIEKRTDIDSAALTQRVVRRRAQLRGRRRFVAGSSLVVVAGLLLGLWGTNQLARRNQLAQPDKILREHEAIDSSIDAQNTASQLPLDLDAELTFVAELSSLQEELASMESQLNSLRSQLKERRLAAHRAESSRNVRLPDLRPLVQRDPYLASTRPSTDF